MAADSEAIADIIENLQLFEETLLAFEEKMSRGETDISLIHIMFRYAHSTKGSLLIIGFEGAAHLVHCIETHFDEMRNGRMPTALKSVIDQTFKGITALIDHLGGSTNEDELEIISAALEAIATDVPPTSSPALSQSFAFQNSEIERCNRAIAAGKTFFQIDKLISTQITEAEYQNLPLFEDIKEYGELIAVRPRFCDVNKQLPEEVLCVIIASDKSKDDLEFCIFDPFKAIELAGLPSVQLPQIPERSPAQSSAKSPLRILIVEDDFSCRRLLQRFLEPFGLVEIAANGREALLAYDSHKAEGIPYHLLCVDCIMPELNGLALLREIRDREKRTPSDSRTKIVMTTSLADSKDVIAATQSGSDAYLIKPIARSTLIESLADIGLPIEI